MGKLIAGMTMSLDGYVNDSAGDTSRLYPEPKKIRELKIVRRAMETTGAVIMGRRAYEMANGDVTGYEFQVPIFVVTHAAPAQPTKGENDKLKLHFISDGVEAAAARAREAAGSKDVTVVGGVSVIQQLLDRGLVDELVMGVVPLFLGGGTRLWGRPEDARLVLEQVEVIQEPGRTDLRYRVRGQGPAVSLIASAAIVIEAPVAHVWHALVTPALIKRYLFGTTVVSEWKEGSPISWKGEWQGKAYEDKGVIQRFELGRTLRYTHWSPLSGRPDTPENQHTVTIELIGHGGQTHLSLSQDRNRTEQERAHAEKNWQTTLDGLKKVVEG